MIIVILLFIIYIILFIYIYIVVDVLTPQALLLLFSISSSPCWEREAAGREYAISSGVFSCPLWWTNSLYIET